MNQADSRLRVELLARVRAAYAKDWLRKPAPQRKFDFSLSESDGSHSLHRLIGPASS